MPALDYHGSVAARSSRFGIVFIIRLEQYTLTRSQPLRVFSLRVRCRSSCRRRAGLLFFGIQLPSVLDRFPAVKFPHVFEALFFFIGCRLHDERCRKSSASSLSPAPSASIGNPCEHRYRTLAVLCQKPPSGGVRGMIGRTLHKAQEHRRNTASSGPVSFPAPSIPPPALGLAAPRFGYASRGPIARYTRSARRPPLDCHQGGKIRELRRDEEYFPDMPLRAAFRAAKSLAQWRGLEGMFVKNAFSFDIHQKRKDALHRRHSHHQPLLQLSAITPKVSKKNTLARFARSPPPKGGEGGFSTPKKMQL